MAASVSYHSNLRLPLVNSVLTASSLKPTGAAFGHAFQVPRAGKVLLGFSSNLNREGGGPSNKVPQSQPPHQVRCSSHRVKINVTTGTDKYRPFPKFGRAHRHEAISSSKSDLHGRMLSSSTQLSSAIDNSHKEERVATVIAVKLQVEKATSAQHWLQRVIPTSLWPYAQLARIEKPTGSYLVALPCFWATSLAAPIGTLTDPKFIALFGVWAFLMRSAACTVNDILDRDIDGKVERTKSRPLASGAASLDRAIWFLALELFVGLAVTYPLNRHSQLLGAVFIVLYSIYPLLKRVTYWPQAFLAFVVNWTLLVSWAAVSGSLDLSILLPLYASGILWTLVYDTIYAHQDRKYDIQIGVKSTAVLFDDKTRAILTGCSVGSVALLALTGSNCGLGWPFYVGVVVAAGHLAWQVGTVDLDDPADCNSKFQSNKWYGAIVWIAIILGNLAATPV